MKTLQEFLAEKREITIHTIASYIRQYLREQYQIVLQEQKEKLLQLYATAGEQTYGYYSRGLFGPLQEQLTRAGFICEPDFPGDFRATSIEYWGPPEERERCLWCVVRNEQGTVLGTLVTQFFHDHIQFRLPHPPGIFVLEETDSEAILEALSHASTRMRGMEHGEMRNGAALRPDLTAWEYSVELGLADYLDPQRIEISEALLDTALTTWGRNGWELTTIVPHQGRLIAFFKRPAKDHTQQ